MKQTEPKEYDDATSTIEEQQEFEKGCLERFNLLTKQTLGLDGSRVISLRESREKVENDVLKWREKRRMKGNERETGK